MTDNVYEPMDVVRLRTALAKHGPLFSEDGTSGFAVASFDEETAEVVWRNAGTDESTRHRDEIERLSRALNRNGYEARLAKPANTTLVVRKVEPVVIHGSALGEHVMGPFERQVERTFSGQTGSALAEAMTRMPAQHRNKLNNEISDMIGSPLREIPLSNMDAAMRRYGYLLVNEDGTPWAGFLTGREGRANIDIGVLGTQDDDQIHQMVDNAMLVLTWYKFNTGRYEVVAYVS